MAFNNDLISCNLTNLKYQLSGCLKLVVAFNKGSFIFIPDGIQPFERLLTLLKRVLALLIKI
jgi:hypothetical protein